MQAARSPSIPFFWQWPAGLFLAACLALLGPPGAARADVAPPQQPGGSSLSPDDTGTPVQMVAERVLFVVGEEADFSVDEWTGRGVLAGVEASFQMRNTAAQAEEMQVRFPLSDPYGRSDGFLRYPLIADFSVSVDGEARDWVRIETENPNDPAAPPVRWAAFDVRFPPGQAVEIVTRYTVHSTGYLPVARFDYVLATGAGWKGPIGAGEIILRLPYIAKPENVLVNEYDAFPGAVMEGNEVRWRFENLEPAPGEDWRVTIFSPDFMNEIYDLREAVADDPQDVAALQALGDDYLQAAEGKRFWFLRSGAEEYLLLAKETYLAALLVAPMDVALNAAYLEALAAHYYAADDFPELAAPTPQELINQINVVFSLDPENETAAEIYADLSYAIEGMPTPGAEPVYVSAAQLPTPTPTATRRVPPTPAPPVETPVPPSLPVLPPGVKLPLNLPNRVWLGVCLLGLCGLGLAAAGAGLLALFVRKRKS